MKRHLIDEAVETNVKKPFLDLNEIPISDDVFANIIFRYIPIYQWPKIQEVSKQFQRTTSLAYRLLQDLNIDEFFPISTKPSDKVKNDSAKLEKFLSEFKTRTPKLKEFSGFSSLVYNFRKKHFILLKQYVNLTSISLDKCTINVLHFAEFIRNFPNLLNLSLAFCTFILSKKTNLPNLPFMEASNLFSTYMYDEDLINAESYLEAFASIIALQNLNLTSITEFTGKFLNHIKADSLKSLNISRTCFFSPYLCNFLRRSKSLEYLDMSTTASITNPEYSKRSVGITSDVFDCLPHLKNLHSIILVGYNGGVDELKKSVLKVSMCKKLREICLIDNCYVSNALISCLVQRCPELEVMRIGVVQRSLSAESLLRLFGLHKIKTLSFYAVNISGKQSQLYQVNREFISRLPQFEMLESLNLGYPVASPKDLEILSTMKTLKKIRIAGNCVTNELVIHWCTNLNKQLLALEMPNCCKISDAAANAIASCIKLKCINFSSSQMTDLAIQKIALQCTELEKVDVTQNQRGRITTKSLIQLLQRCRQMKLLRAKSSVIKELLDSAEYNDMFKYSVELTAGVTSK